MRRHEGTTVRRHGALRSILVVTFALTALLGGCGGPTLAPTPNLFWAMGEDPFADTPESRKSTSVEMLYATDRLPETAGERLRYGYGRSHSLAVGSCAVQMGRDDFSWEQLVEASTVQRRPRAVPLKVTTIEELVRLPPSNTPTALIDGVYRDTPEYLTELAEGESRICDLLRERLAESSQKEVYIYIHGFNNTFEQAALRMAQMWHFMGRPGVALFYTWPAGYPGLLRGYTYDRESSDFTVFHLKQIANIIRGCPEAEKVSIVAHSRGTDVAITAIREVVIRGRGETAGIVEPGKLNNFVLAASDFDWEVFQQQVTAERLGLFADQIVIYLSQDDKAIGMAQWLFGSLRRLGQLGEQDLDPVLRAHLLENNQVQIIDANVRTGGLGHAYFITNPAVLSDLVLVLRDDRLAGEEHGRPLRQEEGGFWTLTDDYLTGETSTSREPTRRSTPSTMNPNPG